MDFVKIFTILAFLLCLATISSEAQPNYLYHICRDATTYTSMGYRDNVNRVLSSISTNAIDRPNGFYDTSEGDGDNRVYGLFLCFGDLSPDVCELCIKNATKEIIKHCPIQPRAIVWYDQCVLRYSDRPIYSIMDTSLAVYASSVENVTSTEQQSFNTVLKTTMRDIATLAASAPRGAIKFDVKVAYVTSRINIYTLAQCTPDLTGEDCSRCLGSAISNLTYGKLGGRVLCPSCNIRYEVYPFYNETGFKREVYPLRNATVVVGNTPLPQIRPPRGKVEK